MLKRLTERAWYLPWEEETDRPNLCYLLGERHSLAVDAGNSPAHVGSSTGPWRSRACPCRTSPC